MELTVVLSANTLGRRKIQNGGQIKFIQKIMDIFVNMFHSKTVSKVIVYWRKYDSTFQVNQHAEL